MKNHSKDVITLVKYYMSVCIMMPSWETYVPDGEGINVPVTKASVQEFIARTAGRFLAQHAAGHTIADVSGYRDCVAGSLYTWEDERGDLRILGGGDMLAMSLSLVACLQRRLREPDVLTMLLAGLNRDGQCGGSRNKWLSLANLACGRRDEEDGVAAVDRCLTGHGDIELCLPTSIRGESLLCFAHWIMIKAHLAITMATTPAGKELILNALKSGETRFL